jgi:hypothetical protein
MSDDPILVRAKVAWRSAILHDDATAVDARLQRLMQRRPPVARGAVPWTAVASAFAMLVILTASRESWRGNGPLAGAPEVAGTLNAPPASEGAPTIGTIAPLVVEAPCDGCSRSSGGALTNGDELAPGDRVDVPAGVVLLLCWGIDGRTEVPGPAQVTVGPAGDLVVLRPEPKAPAKDAPAASARTSAGDAAADVQALALAEWRAAQAAIRAGRRAEAERLLHSLLSRRSAPEGVVEQAGLSLAELQLARGAVDDAREHLHRVERSHDAALAADAVFLDARATPDPAGRAHIYARYLASGPATPYREQAIAERGLALLAAGDKDGATACARTLRAETALPSVAVAPLVRLERALGR